MSEIIDVLSSYPAIVPSVLLIVLLLLGVLAAVGLFDAHHTGMDLDHDLGDFNSAGDVDISTDMLSALGVGKVPLYLIASAVIFPWWILTMIGQIYLMPLLSVIPVWISGTVLMLMALAAALPIAIRIIRPLKPFFIRKVDGARAVDFIGRPCKIITGSVSERFGQAEVRIDNGAPHILQVYASGENTMTRGSGALILSFDSTLKRYEVEAYDG
jgi:hypothetical protein